MNAEQWRRWGPYLSERQWGTVREDYSPHGDAWEYFPHDHARSRAYRWGEDGIAGICDDQQRLCLALALWNGRDPILKERLFGLTNGEGNHGEDVKELLLLPRRDADALVPEDALQVSAARVPVRAAGRGEPPPRQRTQPEFELLDTGVFDDDRYFDVFVEYAKAEPGRHPDARSPCTTAGPKRRRCTCCRSSGSATPGPGSATARSRELALSRQTARSTREHAELGRLSLARRRRRRAAVLATTRPTSRGCSASTQPRLLQGCLPRVRRRRRPRRGESRRRPARRPRRATALDRAGRRLASACALRLTPRAVGRRRSRLRRDASTQRRREADEFYAELQADIADADARRVQRQAFAGMIWSKQFYYYDVPEWLNGDVRRSRRRRRAARTAATATGRTSTTPTSSRCRTSGSIRGTPPGTWRSTAFRWRWSTPSSPSSSSCC